MDDTEIKKFTKDFTLQEPISDVGIEKALRILKSGKIHRYNVGPGEKGEAALPSLRDVFLFPRTAGDLQDRGLQSRPLRFSAGESIRNRSLILWFSCMLTSCNQGNEKVTQIAVSSPPFFQ